MGRNVCRLKGGWLGGAPSPDSHRPAKPCGNFIRHPENSFWEIGVAGREVWQVIGEKSKVASTIQAGRRP